MAATPRAEATARQDPAQAGGPLDLGEIEATRFDQSDKGIPGGTPAFRLDEIGRHGWNVLREDPPLPVAVLKRSALDFNAAWMQSFAERHGVLHAPHGKTLVAPQIYTRQLGAGAWGITAATVHQLQVCRRRARLPTATSLASASPTPARCSSAGA